MANCNILCIFAPSELAPSGVGNIIVIPVSKIFEAGAKLRSVMPTMYETIQGLPIFQGTTAEQISAFLEKTDIEFINYSAYEIIAEEGDECSDIKFLISGTVRAYSTLANGKVSMNIVMGGGSMLSACNIFGLHTQYPVTVVGETSGTYMKIQKSQFFKLLSSAPIYLLNYLNLLSYAAQRLQIAMRANTFSGFRQWITIIKEGLAARHTKEIILKSTRQNLAETTGQSLLDLEASIVAMQQERLIEAEGDITIKLI